MPPPPSPPTIGDSLQISTGGNIKLKKRLGSGNQGTVYEVEGHPNWAAKIFKQPATQEVTAKLEYMINPAHVKTEIKKFTAWPEALLRKNGVVYGYTMRFLKNTDRLNEFIAPPATRVKTYPEDWKARVKIAQQLASCFYHLHKSNYVVGDAKSENILIDGKDGSLCVIDCDSFQACSGNRIFSCTVGSDEYLAPELRGMKSKNTQRTPNHDNFSLAVLIFKLLFEAEHPFDGSSPDNVTLGEAIQGFRYSYAKDARSRLCEPPLLAIRPEALLPSNMVTMFEQAFTEYGRHQRPTAEAWYKALGQLSKNLDTCIQGRHWVYKTFQHNCPWCTRERERQRLFGKQVPPPVTPQSARPTTPPVTLPPVTPAVTQTKVSPPQAQTPSQGFGDILLDALGKLLAWSFKKLLEFISEHYGVILVTLFVAIVSFCQKTQKSDDTEEPVSKTPAPNVSTKPHPTPMSENAATQYERGGKYYFGLGVDKDYSEAAKWFRKAAEQGHAKAQFILGVMYANGQGVAQDNAEAVKWYRRAAEQGNAKAQLNLGVMYANGQGVAQDNAEAVKWFRKAAEQGDTDAQRRLKRLREVTSTSEGQNMRKPISDFMAEFDSHIHLMTLGGYAILDDAIYVLSTRTISNSDYRKDPDGMYTYKASVIVTKILAGKIVAQTELAQLYSGQYSGPMDDHHRRGYSAAQDRSVIAVVNGRLAVFINEQVNNSYTQTGYLFSINAKTLSIYNRSTLFSEANWGWFPYFDGDGNLWHFSAAGYYEMKNTTRVRHVSGHAVVRLDASNRKLVVAGESGRIASDISATDLEARLLDKLKKRVAKNNQMSHDTKEPLYAPPARVSTGPRPTARSEDTATQYELGNMHYYGRGVVRDYSEAAKWYRKAAEQGHANAQNNLGLMYRKGQGVTQDYAEAVKWFRKATEQRDATAQFNLGWMYEYGAGVTKDDVEAVKWYRKAAEQGHSEAQFNLGYVYEHGRRGITQDYAEAVKWYRKTAEQGNKSGLFYLGKMYAAGLGVAKNCVEASKWLSKAREQGTYEADLVIEKYCS